MQPKDTCTLYCVDGTALAVPAKMLAIGKDKELREAYPAVHALLSVGDADSVIEESLPPFEVILKHYITTEALVKTTCRTEHRVSVGVAGNEDTEDAGAMRQRSDGFKDGESYFLLNSVRRRRELKIMFEYMDYRVDAYLSDDCSHVATVTHSENCGHEIVDTPDIMVWHIESGRVLYRICPDFDSVVTQCYLTTYSLLTIETAVDCSDQFEGTEVRSALVARSLPKGDTPDDAVPVARNLDIPGLGPERTLVEFERPVVSCARSNDGRTLVTVQHTDLALFVCECFKPETFPQTPELADVTAFVRNYRNPWGEQCDMASKYMLREGLAQRPPDRVMVHDIATGATLHDCSIDTSATADTRCCVSNSGQTFATCHTGDVMDTVDVRVFCDSALRTTFTHATTDVTDIRFTAEEALLVVACAGGDVAAFDLDGASVASAAANVMVASSRPLVDAALTPGGETLVTAEDVFRDRYEEDSPWSTLSVVSCDHDVYSCDVAVSHASEPLIVRMGVGR